MKEFYFIQISHRCAHSIHPDSQKIPIKNRIPFLFMLGEMKPTPLLIKEQRPKWQPLDNGSKCIWIFQLVQISDLSQGVLASGKRSGKPFQSFAILGLNRRSTWQLFYTGARYLVAWPISFLQEVTCCPIARFFIRWQAALYQFLYFARGVLH